MLQSNKSFWHVVYTYPKNEKSIVKKLTDKKITHAELEVFLPTRIVNRTWSDRNKKLEDVLFPRYLFVKVKPKERWHVLKTPGVVNFITTDGVPCGISENEIDVIRKASALNVQHELPIKRGEPVKILYGPLMGIEGELFEQQGNKRLLIYVKSINKSVSVSMSDCYRSL